MHVYTDTEGRRWELALTVAAVRRLRAWPGVDLYSNADIQRMTGDPIVAMDVIWALVGEAPAGQVTQASAYGVDADGFYEGMLDGDGEAFDAASVALLEELRDFFRKSRRPLLVDLVDAVLEARPKLEAAQQRTRPKIAGLVDKMIQAAEADLDAADAAMERALSLTGKE